MTTIEIPFNNEFTTMLVEHIVNGPLTLTINQNNQVIKGGAYLIIVADGTNTPNLSAFKRTTTSSRYDNRDGIVNVLNFLFDGKYYWLNIWQDANAVPLPPYNDVVFDDLRGGATFDNATKTLKSNGNINSGGYLSTPIVMTESFSVIYKILTPQTVLALDSTKNNNFNWTGNSFISSVYENGTIDTLKIVPHVLNRYNTANRFIRMKKAGNDLVYSHSLDGSVWSDFYTHENALAGITTVYIKGLFVNNGINSIYAKFRN